MIDMTVARRYAKALLTLGKEDAHYKEYGEGLSGFAHLLEREPELKDALLNPIHGREDRNKLLLRMIELLQLPPMVSNLLQLLLDKHRLNVVEGVALAYQIPPSSAVWWPRWGTWCWTAACAPRLIP